jgi:hypothetical protein
LEATQQAKEEQHIVSFLNHKPSFPPLPKPTNFSPPATPLKIQKLTRDEMVKFQLKGLCYNCDDKYFPGTIVRKNIFKDVTKDLTQEDVFDQPDVYPMISLNFLTSFYAP